MTVRNSRDLLAIIIISVYLFVYILVPTTNVITNICRIVLFLVLGLLSIGQKTYKKQYLFLIWYTVFCCLCFLSINWALDKRIAFEGSKTILWNLLCIGMISFYMRNKAKLALAILKIITVIPVVWPFEVMLNYGASQLLNVRDVMIGAEYNKAAMFAAFGAIIAYFIVRNRTVLDFMNVKNKYCYILILILDVMVCVLSTSRKSIVVTISVIILYEILNSKDIIKLMRNIFWGLLLLVFLFLILTKINILYELVGKNLISMINGIFNISNVIDSSTHARMGRISRGIMWFKESKLLGYGTENYSVLSGMYKAGFDGIADNNYIELLVDFGVVGFIIYYLYIFRCIVKSLKNFRNSSLYMLSLLILISILIFDYGASNYKSAGIFLMFAICSCFIEYGGEQR